MVTVDVAASKLLTAEYIRCAIRCHGGAYRPEDAFFHLEYKHIKVRPIKSRS